MNIPGDNLIKCYADRKGRKAEFESKNNGDKEEINYLTWE